MAANKFRIGTFNAISRIGLSRFKPSTYQVGALDAAEGAMLERPHALMLRSHKLSVKQIPKTVCAIARCGAGTNNIPVDDLTTRGIPVFNTPGSNANAVKELVLCGMLLASRGVHQGINHVESLAQAEGFDVAKGRVEKDKKLFAGQELRGKTLGLVGLGNIGVSVAKAAADLGMKVVGYDPHLSIDAALSLPGESVVRANSIEHVVGAADYLSLHLPVIKGVTEGIISRELIGQMRPNCNIINYARGELVDTQALRAAMDAGVINGYYVNDFPDEHMYGHTNNIAMPHLGASTAEAEENSATMAADTLMQFLETGSIRNSVNFPNVSMEAKPTDVAMRVCIVNENRSGMLAAITSLLSDLNIVRQVNDSKADIAYNIVDLDEMPKDRDGLVAMLLNTDGVLSARFITNDDGVERYALNRDDSLLG